MSLQSKILCAAALGLMAGCGTKEAAKQTMGDMGSGDSSSEQELVRCFGINSCQGMSKCAVTQADVDATKAAFGDTYIKTELHDCSGAGSCAAQKGMLSWVQVTKQECFGQNGFLIVEAADGSKTVQEQ